MSVNSNQFPWRKISVAELAIQGPIVPVVTTVQFSREQIIFIRAQYRELGMLGHSEKEFQKAGIAEYARCEKKRLIMNFLVTKNHHGSIVLFVIFLGLVLSSTLLFAAFTSSFLPIF